MTLLTHPQPLTPPTVVDRARAILQRRATWVLFDQGIVSLGNFITTNLLVRHLTESECGTYGVLLETLLYLNGLQAALIVYPLTIKGATGGRHSLGRLATASVLLTLLLVPLLGGATAVSVAALDAWHVVPTAVAAMLLWQIQETLRRALMADLRFSEAVWGDLIRYIGQVGGILLVVSQSRLTLNSAFTVMGVTATLAILVQALQVGLAPLRLIQLRVIALRFWRLGRWMLLTNATGLITGLSYWWLLRWRHGAAECAVFVAITALFKLANPVMSSLSGLIVPAVARAEKEAGDDAARRSAIRYSALGAAMLIPYFAFLAVLPATALKLFYGPNTPYVSSATWLGLFVGNYTMVYLSTVASAWLAGLGLSRDTFNAQVVGIIATLLVGLPMTLVWGVPGLVVGGLVSAGAATIACIYFIRHHQYQPSPGSL